MQTLTDLLQAPWMKMILSLALVGGVGGLIYEYRVTRARLDSAIDMVMLLARALRNSKLAVRLDANGPILVSETEVEGAVARGMRVGEIKCPCDECASKKGE